MRTNLTSLPSNASPTLAALMSGDISVAQLRAMRPLPENAQKLIDDAVVRVGLDRLVLVGDLLAEGLTFNIGQEFWGITDLQWDEQDESGVAHRTMDPMARGENQITDRRPRNIPVYLTWDSFNLGIRTLAASQRSGAPLDTTMVEQATRRVNEGIEDAAINGIAAPVFGSTVYGLLNAPNVNAFTYGAAGGPTSAWTHASKTGQDILDDVLGMMDLARAARRFGPYNLYIPTTYGTALAKNFSDGVVTFDKTIRMRLEEIVAGGRNIRIREVDQLPSNRTTLVQMTSDIIDVVIGQQPTVVSWQHPSGWAFDWVVMSCVVPRVKTDYNDKSGIVTGNI